jgi:hypothetical protein
MILYKRDSRRYSLEGIVRLEGASRVVMPVDLAAGDFYGAASIVQVIVDGIHIADDELDEHPAGGGEGFLDVR